MKKKFRKKHGIKRVDFVFYPQRMSNRPMGGIALGKIWSAKKFKGLHQQYEVNEATRLSPTELRPILEKILNEIE
jgi:hypothetical protein